MHIRTSIAATAVLILATNAHAQSAQPTRLYGVRANGDLLQIDPATGAASFIGGSGVACEAASPRGDVIAVAGGTGATADRVTLVNRFTGAPFWRYEVAGRPPGYEVRGLAGGLVLLSPATGVDLLASHGPEPYTYTVIGPTGRDDLEALAQSPWGVIYALGSSGGGVLCTIDTSTGAATVIGGGGFGTDTAALEFLPDGTLLACGQNLRSVDPLTGIATLRGATGYSDIRGMAAVRRSGCYPDCNGCLSGNHCPPPYLNVAQFTCFLQRFAVGDPYTNCDESTTQPVLNVADFTCFLQQFAAGCP